MSRAVRRRSSRTSWSRSAASSRPSQRSSSMRGSVADRSRTERKLRRSAAQAAARDAHPVDAVGLGAAYGGVVGEQGVGLGVDAGEDVVAGGFGVRARWSRGWGRGRSPEGACQFRRGGRRVDAGVAEVAVDGVEEGGVGAVGEFDFDLGPVGGAAVPGEAFRVDGVGAEFGEEGAVGVDEVVDVAGGAEPSRRAEGAAAGLWRGRGRPGRGYLVGEGARSRRVRRGDGSFQVPAARRAAGARRRVRAWAARRRSVVS